MKFAVNGTDSEAFKTTRDSDFVSRDFWYISGKKSKLKVSSSRLRT